MNDSFAKLNLPHYEFRINADQIFDPVRKKWVALTPEEWVRQNFIMYLIEEKNYPRSLIKIEETIEVFNKIKRCDAVMYTNEIQPLVIIECKRTKSRISKKTFEQIAVYNSAILAKFLIVTNGLDHFCIKFNFKDNTHKFLQDIPMFAELK